METSGGETWRAKRHAYKLRSERSSSLSVPLNYSDFLTAVGMAEDPGLLWQDNIKVHKSLCSCSYSTVIHSAYLSYH
jgi:hypothetical protein